MPLSGIATAYAIIIYCNGFYTGDVQTGKKTTKKPCFLLKLKSAKI
jgi:hypothetical protein